MASADDRIIDHYKHPRHKGTLATPTVRKRDVNPFCGDEVTIELLIEDDQIVDAAFDGRGCSLSLATASILLDEIVGKPTAEVNAWGQKELLDLLEIEIGPVRQKCALLPLNVLHACLDEGESTTNKEDELNE